MNNSGTERRNGGILWGREAKDTEFSGFFRKKCTNLRTSVFQSVKRNAKNLRKVKLKSTVALFVCM